MSAGPRTEKPTDKKKHDASKRGQSWRSQDLIALLVLFAGAGVVRYALPVADMMGELIGVAQNGFVMPLDDYLKACLKRLALASAMVIVAAIVVSVVPSLLMSRFRLATEALRVDFSVLDPIAGFKRIFSLRTVKDAMKACLYFVAFTLTAWMFWRGHRVEILALARLTPMLSALKMGELLFSFWMTVLGATLGLVLSDLFLEYLLYIRDLKMTREEVKREHKDMYGTPELKRERHRRGQELLSGEVMANVEQSNFVLANPTHIAVGIYINPAISILPFISAMEIDERALAVIAHARSQNVPVIRNVALARQIFKEHRRYTFVSEDYLTEIGEVLRWLADVERSRMVHYVGGGER